MSAEVEKWIVTQKELHLGHCKETFRVGAIIEFEAASGRLSIDGRRFNDTRDLDVLKRQAIKYPRSPWIIPYSQEAYDEVMATIRPPAVSEKRVLHPDQKLTVIQSDEDLSEAIDISETKVSKINAAAKEAARNKVKTDGMEVIRGDESVEDRIASLKGKTDMGSIAERARLKATGSVKMPIVKDDSLGAGFTGKSSQSLNAGQHLPSRADAEANKEDAAAQASARKHEAEMKRTKAEGIGEDAPAPAPAPAPVENSEMAVLRSENAALKAQMDRMEKMIVAQQAAAPRRGRPPKSESKGGAEEQP